VSDNIKMRIPVLWIWIQYFTGIDSVDPDPGKQKSSQKRNNEEISCQGLDILSRGLKASPGSGMFLKKHCTEMFVKKIWNVLFI
jgi:hypothetical protein